MYYNNDEYNYYLDYYYRYPTLVPTNTIQQQIALGRQGHCFKSTWGGREHTFNLMGIDAQGMVSIMENGVPNSVFHNDMVGLQYLGVQCPMTPSTGGGMGGSQGGGMGGGQGGGMGGGQGGGMGGGQGGGMGGGQGGGMGGGQGFGQQCHWQWTNQGWKWICR